MFRHLGARGRQISVSLRLAAGLHREFQGCYTEAPNPWGGGEQLYKSNPQRESSTFLFPSPFVFLSTSFRCAESTASSVHHVILTSGPSLLISETYVHPRAHQALCS